MIRGDLVRIVIAEDERIIALGLSSVLKKLGHEVKDLCASGELCIESVERNHPDVVFMDIRMDGLMDGIEAAQIVRERFDTPVVFTTAFDDNATRERAAKVKPLAFLTTPIGSDSIRSVLDTVSQNL
jgi:CheY-like chemotaxis protein